VIVDALGPQALRREIVVALEDDPGALDTGEPRPFQMAFIAGFFAQVDFPPRLAPTAIDPSLEQPPGSSHRSARMSGRVLEI
jgi:hypothetical protein